MDVKLEVVVLPVSDVDRAKRFYEGLGWREDADIVGGPDFRIVQLTPPGSACSISFGTGVTTTPPGSQQGLLLVTEDIEATRAEYVERGAPVSEVFHGPAGRFHPDDPGVRLPGRDPEEDGRADDAPLREDIRLLGRVLGEVIREQSGDDVLALVEATRVEAFRLRRSEVDRADVAARLDGLDVRSANHVIRAFSHFSLLANLAEDLHHERRRRFHRIEGSPPQKGSLAATFELLDAAHLDADVVARELAGALVSPVVTAHPTEVRRRSVSRVQRQITELIRRRDRSVPGEADDPAWSGELQRAVLTLWQTALLRLSRLRLADEIDEALRYYELSLLEVVPAINAELRRELCARWPTTPATSRRSGPTSPIAGR